MDVLKPCWGKRNEPSGPPAASHWIQTRAASSNGVDLEEGHLCSRKWAGPEQEEGDDLLRRKDLEDKLSQRSQ